MDKEILVQKDFFTNHSETGCFFSHWEIPWHDFEVAFGLKSFLDQNQLDIKNLEEARSFLKNCGFDLNDPRQEKQFDEILSESLFFIRHFLLTEEERKTLWFPAQILFREDPAVLFLFASSLQPKERYLRLWSCALLKIMFAVANVYYNSKLSLLPAAREQIFKKIQSVVCHDHLKKTLIQFKNFSLPLVKVEWKNEKSRESVILKLLHKPEALVDDIFDYLGVRFVVKKLADIPLLLKILIEANILIPHQTISMRTRNSLLSIKKPKKILNFLHDLSSGGILSDFEFQKMCESVNWQISYREQESYKKTNHFTSQHYRSLQFTVRHLVRLVNPACLALQALNLQLQKSAAVPLEFSSSRFDFWKKNLAPETLVGYFPIEIQIFDEEGDNAARQGSASHARYKAEQLKAVRQRILGRLLALNKDKVFPRQ